MRKMVFVAIIVIMLSFEVYANDEVVEENVNVESFEFEYRLREIENRVDFNRDLLVSLILLLIGIPIGVPLLIQYYNKEVLKKLDRRVNETILNMGLLMAPQINLTTYRFEGTEEFAIKSFEEAISSYTALSKGFTPDRRLHLGYVLITSALHFINTTPQKDQFIKKIRFKSVARIIQKNKEEVDVAIYESFLQAYLMYLTQFKTHDIKEMIRAYNEISYIDIRERYSTNFIDEFLSEKICKRHEGFLEQIIMETPRNMFGFKKLIQGKIEAGTIDSFVGEKCTQLGIYEEIEQARENSD